MNYYKDENGDIYAYDDEQVSAGLVVDKVAMTPEEVQVHLNPPVVPMTYEEVRLCRRLAYANPETGCDGFFAEASRLSVMGGTAEEIAAAHDKGVARYEEIGLEYPWP